MVLRSGVPERLLRIEVLRIAGRQVRNFGRLLRTVCVVAIVAVLGAGCDGSPDREAFTFDDVVLFAGLDTRAVVMAQEESVAACMAREGFEYIPYVPRNADTYPAPGTLAALPDADYVAGHGFGLADRVLLHWTAESDDPNAEIAAAMSPDQRTEYSRSLFGASTTDGSIPGGCRNSGFDPDYIDAVDGVSQLRFDAAQRMEADERFIEIMIDWSRCMAAEGFDFGDRRIAVFDYFGPKTDNVLLSHDENARQDLAAEEMLVARADLRCVGPYESALAEIAAEYEDGLAGDAQTYLEYLATLAETYGYRTSP